MRSVVDTLDTLAAVSDFLVKHQHRGDFYSLHIF